MSNEKQSSSGSILPQHAPINSSSSSSKSSSITSQQQPPPVPSPKKQYTWLAIYFFFNLALTLFNKVVLGKFPFPYTLTAVHALSGTVGCFILERAKVFSLSRLTSSEMLSLIFFSFLYTINIAISNVSLGLVTVPFHQVVRATTPLFAIGLNIVLYRSRYPFLTYMSLLLVVAGVGFATFGDYYSTPLGFLLTLLGAFLAALKTVITNRIQTGRLRLSPLELLYRMSPLAFLQTLVYAYFTGELSIIYSGINNIPFVGGGIQGAGGAADTYNNNNNNMVAVPEIDHGKQARSLGALSSSSSSSDFVLDRSLIIKLLLNGLIAFGLNVVSFTANKNTSALTMTVAANIKQVMTIVLAILFFNLRVNLTNSFGIFLTLLGGAWYAKLELDRKQKPVTTANQSKN